MAIGHPDAKLVINAAAFVPKPSVDLCKNDPVRTIMGNVIFPTLIASACRVNNTPLIHFSTGCLYDDKKEYSEADEPTRDLTGYCGLYLASKLAAEKSVWDYQPAYVLRIRLPFDEQDHPQNYLSKLRKYPEIWNHTNSLSHRGDCVKAALDLWEKKAPYGIYNLVNPGCITAATIINMWGLADKKLTLGPVDGTRLSTDKLAAAGIEMRHVHDAVQHALENWTVQPPA